MCFAENPLRSPKTQSTCLRSWLMLRKPDPKPSVQRRLARLASSTPQPPSPVATQTHTPDKWTSKHRPSPTAKLTPLLSESPLFSG